MAVEKDELLAMMRAAAQGQKQTQARVTVPASTAPAANDQGDEADQMLAQMKAAAQQFPEQREWYKEFTPTAIGRTAAGAADVLLGVIPAAAGKVAEYATQFRQPSLPLNRLTPQQMFAEQQARAREAARAKQETTAAVEQYLPGRLAGVTETPEYKGELLQQLSSRLGQAVAPKVEQAGQYYESLGLMPKEQVASAIETGAAALTPPVAGAVTRGAKAVARGVKGAAAEVKAARAVRAGEPPAAPDLQAELDARRSMGAAQVEANPYKANITGEEGARGVFPQVKLSKTPTDVPKSEQAIRSEIATEILGDGGQVRTGVITGNENTLRNEYAEAKSAQPTPKGKLLKEQIANEQNALSNYAQQRVENTGANPYLTGPYERGQSIYDSFGGEQDSIRGFLQQEKSRLYNDARSVVGENPIQTTNVDELLADPQFKAGLKLRGTEGVAGGASELIELARSTGFRDPVTGVMYGPNTINAWDAVRKALNQNWTPANARVIRDINTAIDRDIASAGGGDMLKRADAIHQAEKTMFGSKGIKELFGELDLNGVETGVAFENIPKKLNSMPFSQWRHIYDTADRLSKGKIFGPIDKATGLPKWELPIPAEVQASARHAKAEMLGSLAREVYEAGAAKAGEWNQNSVNKVLNARADKISYAFPLEEQQAFHKLNYGGYLMPGQHGYLGAGIETQRMGLLTRNLPMAGAELGAATNIPGAAAAGEKIGERVQARILGKKQAAEAAELAAEMQRNAQLGRTPISSMAPKKP